MTGNEIREVLERARVLPSKQLGQNFLIDANISKWIVAQLELSPEDTVVEVGPGAGSLTEHLIGIAKRVILIEFDARLAEDLRQRFQHREDIEVHHADGAKFDRRLLFRHRPVKFLGNLPYSSGGAIMKNLLARPHPFSRAVIMLQKEVIDRLVAKPRSKDYGMLTLRMQVDWHIKPLKIVPPEAFHPRPRIDSAVAVLMPRSGKDQPVFDARLFDELIRRGFAQRRKQLGKQLPDTPPWETVSSQLGLALTTRAEELDLNQWIALAQTFDTHPLKNTAQDSEEIFDVVDENDVPVGQATRAKVHAEHMLHRAVHVFVLNRNGDLWLQKRSHHKDMNSGLWDSSVSGHLDAGEDYAQAAQRELGEEIGINQESRNPCKEILAQKPCAENGWEHVRLFLTEHKGAVTFPAAEIESMMAFPITEIEAWLKNSPQDFSPTFRMMFHAWRAS